jgi:hypothetical protein
MAQLAARRDAARPGNDERVANPAAMRVKLVAPERRVRRHRPAERVVAVRVGPADRVDPRQLFGHRLAPQVARPGQIDPAEKPALLTGAIVRQHQDQRAVALARLFEKADEPRQMLVGMVEHCRIGRLQAGKEPPLVGRMLGPGFHALVARRQHGRLGHDPHCLLPRKAAVALGVPPALEQRVVAADQVGWRLVRRVARAERQP